MPARPMLNTVPEQLIVAAREAARAHITVWMDRILTGLKTLYYPAGPQIDVLVYASRNDFGRAVEWRVNLFSAQGTVLPICQVWCLAEPEQDLLKSAGDPDYRLYPPFAGLALPALVALRHMAEHAGDPLFAPHTKSATELFDLVWPEDLTRVS